ncbi:hypothetical protein [Nostoc sp. DSM 114167]|uniref:hypothetical protein n=1 Tax=Nostoc sp. DSM 114167 TaxID=3439050 RepID=UPI004045312A
MSGNYGLGIGDEAELESRSSTFESPTIPSLQPTIPNCDKLSQMGRGKNEQHHQSSPRSQVWD